jgi:hypothetical protein
MNVSVDIDEGTNRHAISRVIKGLAERGWVAKEDKFSDQRDNATWHKLKIEPDNIPEHTR